MLSRKEIELLAPAGSYESLQAAIQGGADAVYFGVEKLNMRSRSSFNFTMDDLDKVIAIAGEHQMHTYLTLNAVIYNNELEHIKEIIDRAGKAGITAIIASDPSVISTARGAGEEDHISTQLNKTNKE